MFRTVIEAELKRRGWTTYRLAKEVEGRVAYRCVYSFLSGERDLGSESVAVLCQVLRLELHRKPARSGRSRRK